MKIPVYMDYHATTPVDPRVLDAMIPFFTEKFGNPSSRQHRFGWEAEDAVERARATIARAIGAEAREIIFTSGATESNNLALKGVAGALRSNGDEIVTVATEHKSVLDVAHRLAGDGFRVTILPVDADGVLDPADLRKAITEKTVLVSVMAANNEIGTLQDMPALAEICRERKVLFHSDATQAVGKIPVDLRAIGCDFLSFTGHKLYGPKGVGCLVVRTHPRQVRLLAQIDGGGHERGFRSGTLNVPGIVGLAKAVELAVAELGPEAERLRSLRDRMWHSFMRDLGDVALNGHATKRLPGNLNVSFLQVDENTLMMEMKDLAVSTGSACTSTSPEPSHVLKALGIGKERMHSAIRFGLGRFTTEEEVGYATERVIQSVKKLRSVSQSYRQQQTPVH